MTVICYKDGVMAADSLASGDAERMFLDPEKIWHTQWGLAGAGGDAEECEIFRVWTERGRPDNERPTLSDSFQGIVVVNYERDDGHCIFLYGGTCFGVPIRDYTFPIAIGAGAREARAALLAGASAPEAVRITCMLNGSCSLPVTALELNMPKNKGYAKVTAKAKKLKRGQTLTKKKGR